MSDIPPKVRRAVHERAEGRCERCSRTGPLELHHRKYRSRGGKHTVDNLVALCGWGNHTGCHGWAHTTSPTDGWSLNSWADPSTEPITFPDGSSWLLLADGTRREITREEGGRDG